MRYKNTTHVPYSKGQVARRICFLGASSMVLAMAAPAAFAQDVIEDEVIATGIIASLDRARDLKRNSDGVVDGISAEDIGKFPDTNLAESLQRITGVSINRVNGEGSQVTVRGFSGDFNLVTLNGRTLPGADVPLAGTDRSGSAGNSRAFDFSNLASEGVSGIQVYKTGKATLPSGGIGATVNIETAKPLDNPGLNATFGAKLQHDTSVDTGSDITPEFSGLVSWTDDSEKFGVGLFGSYSKRDSAAAASSVAGWNISSFDELAANTGLVGPNTNVVNAPSDGSQLIGIPNDSRYHFSELERERLNGQLVLQFKPSDNINITADALYARNDNNETRSDVANWFGATFTEIVVDSNPDVLTPTSLSAVYPGENKDFALAQDEVGTRDELTSFGINVDWDASDSLKFVLDGHTSKAEVSPTLNSTATGDTLSRIEVGMAAPFVDAQTQLFGSSGIPVQQVSITNGPDGQPGLSILDVSTTVAGNIVSTTQENTVDEIDFRGIWEADDSSSFTAGVNYRSQENITDTTNYFQILGFWDAGQPGDIAEFAPGVLEQFCLSCRFDDFETGISDGAAQGQSFRGSANELFNAISPVYDGRDGTATDISPNDNSLGVSGNTFNTVNEDIFSLFGSFDKKFSIGNRDASVSIGMRYEETDLTSTSVFTVPTGITFTSDNDNNVIFGGSPENVEVDFSYSNFLPNVDLSVDVTDDIVARASYSQTIARPGFGSLVTNTSVSSFNQMSVFGGTATGASGNPELLPLQSDNFDASVEWYYGASSFVTAGIFHKRVDNFLGSGSVEQSLFGLRDVFSGEGGTRSGEALALINGINGAAANAVNLYTLTTLLDNSTDRDQTIADFEASIQANGESSLFQGLSGTAITANASDPLINFLVNQELNNEEGRITGIELSAQHFFGDSGFGVAGSYTYVDGDVDFDVNAPQGSDQFALTGISDTANATLIYENYGLSARFSYNWRDNFLASTNIGAGNPLFVEAFGQFDANISYDINDQISVSFEGINLTGENLRTYTRSESQLVFAQELKPRYLVGARYKF